MTISRFLRTGAVAIPLALALPSHARAATVAAAPRVVASRPPASWDDADPADSLYRAAREALNTDAFRRAATLFEEISRRYPTSKYAADAYYWRAFALYSLGRDDDLHQALASLDAQRARFPKASTASDARTLEVRIQGALARHGDATSAEAVTSAAQKNTACPNGRSDRDDENDMRIAAMNALLQMDAEQAVPIIKQVLQRRDACSAALRRKGVFLLSQKQTSETETLLMDVARNDPSSDVREQAVFWLGQVHTEKAAAALEQLATSSPDMALREKAVFAIEQQDMPRGAALIRRLAESPDSPESVRERAVWSLGQKHSAENAAFLRGLFTRAGKGDRNEEFRKKILFSLSQMQGEGNDRWLLTVVLDNTQSEEVRKHALFSAGQAGVSGSELIALYDKLTDAEVRKQLIWVLSESRDKAGLDKLVEIAQKDRDPEMRKKAIFWLSQKNDPRIAKILLDIINHE